MEASPPAGDLSLEARRELLVIARKAIRERLDVERSPRLGAAAPELARASAVFVTLSLKDGSLRGCVGTLRAEKALAEAVAQMARAAAFEDPRFLPVGGDEVNEVAIEISVLEPPKRVRSGEEIRPLKDGVLIRYEGREGVFLPQVWEKIRNREDFLAEICVQKLGLPPLTWRDPKAEVYTFEAFSFGEGSPPGKTGGTLI